MHVHRVLASPIVKECDTLPPYIVNKWQTVGQVKLVHRFLGNVAQVHQDAPDRIFMTRNQHPLSILDCLGHDAFGIKRYGAVHAIPQTLRLGKLAVHLNLPRLDAAINRLAERNAQVPHLLSPPVVVPGIVQRIRRYSRRLDLEAASPFLELVFAVLVCDHLLALSGQGTVHSLVQPPALDDGEPSFVELINAVPSGLDCPLKPARVDDIELKSVHLEKPARASGVLDTLWRQRRVFPAGEKSENVVGRPAMADEYDNWII
mmetsp:Transcript_37182/g.88997  ORF Transcript_37182/g.88997 Transcript_37182/m.88997 type:complete len:261 (-) Transcript_37182:1628-2410(-)